MRHMACSIFNLETNIGNSLLTLTNELTSGDSHRGANTDYNSVMTNGTFAPDEPPSNNTSVKERCSNTDIWELCYS